MIYDGGRGTHKAPNITVNQIPPKREGRLIVELIDLFYINAGTP